jgi:hypothetical protein
VEWRLRVSNTAERSIPSSGALILSVRWVESESGTTIPEQKGRSQYSRSRDVHQDYFFGYPCPQNKANRDRRLAFRCVGILGRRAMPSWSAIKNAGRFRCNGRELRSITVWTGSETHLCDTLRPTPSVWLADPSPSNPRPTFLINNLSASIAILPHLF